MVLLSPEDVTINGITLSTLFNGSNGYFIVNEVVGRHETLKQLQTANALGQHGAHLLGSNFGPRPMRIFFTLKGASFEDLRKKMDLLNEIIYSNEIAEIKFADEPNMAYFATVEGVTETLERNSIHQGTIDLLRLDPFKYGAIKQQEFVNGAAIIQNNGTRETYPRFVLHPNADITYLDIINNNQYMRIGRPADTGEEPVQTETLVFYDEAESVVGWQASAAIEQGTVTGAISSNTYTFNPSSFGTGAGWHGPAIQRDIPFAPLTDYVVEVGMIMRNPTTQHIGRIVVELLDINNRIIGRFNINKQAEGNDGNKAAAYAGNTLEGERILLTQGRTNTEYKDFHGLMRIAKRGNVWTAYVAQTHEQTHEHYSRETNKFIDVDNQFTGELAQIRLHFGVYGSKTPAPMYIRYVKVWHVNMNDQTGPEVIAGEGDEIIIDHEKDSILINGEPSIYLKDFGANYFALPKGQQTILLEPSNAIEGTISYREKYL